MRKDYSTKKVAETNYYWTEYKVFPTLNFYNLMKLFDAVYMFTDI